MREKAVLIVSIFIAGLCSIIYELLISTTSSYFLGDSIRQFSVTIGLYMAAMGVGSYLSRLFERQFLWRFIETEILLGLAGGISVPLLYLAFIHTGVGGFNSIMIGLILLIGLLTGLEIPFLTQLMKEHYPLGVNLSNVLSLDYLGALIATLLFPFFLLPWLGVFGSSVVFGSINIVLAFINLWHFGPHLPVLRRRLYWAASIAIFVLFAGLLAGSNYLLAEWNDRLYKDRIIFAKTTPYQTLVLTQRHDDLRLYIDRIIQFSSVDEYRYHESLLHPAMSLAPYRKQVLILGGGEGLAAREALKYADVEGITIVDIDAEVFRIARETPQLRELNAGSLDNPKVTTVAEDAFVFLQNTPQLFDVIVADLPDPSNDALARLYSREFFKLIRSRLTPNGIFVTQATSPFHTREAFWCIEASLRASGFTHTLPYHAYVPSFGDWGFIAAANRPLQAQQAKVSVPMRFLDPPTLQKLFHFEPDLLPVDSIQPSSLDRPELLDYYLEGWQEWSREGVE